MRRRVRPRPGLALGLASLLAAACGPHNVRPNVETEFNPVATMPAVAPTAFIHDDATVIGSVAIGRRVFVGPHAFLRADEGQHMTIGDDSNVQDCAGIHALETVEHDPHGWHHIHGREFTSDGQRAPEGHPESDEFAVYVGRRVSIAHQALVHGPAWVGDDCFIGMQALVFDAKVGPGCFIAPGALVMGVEIAAGRLVPPGAVVTTQEAAGALAPVKGTRFEKLNAAVIHVNTTLAEQYRQAAR